jgi:O-antigen biosynthesis protein
MLSRLRRAALLILTLVLSPVLAVLSLTLLFFNLVHLVTRFTRKPVPEIPAPRDGLATIVVLNWNGRDLLAEGIPSVIDAVRRDGRPHEILVVDNGSNDGSAEFVRTSFPDVKVLDLPENLGFGAGNNVGVMAATHEIVVLLNNDMVVDPGFLRPLLDGFGPSTFAVSSQIFLQDRAARREETGLTSARFRRGMVDFEHRNPAGRRFSRRAYPVFWAGGGSSAFHRGRFLALGGFDEVYSPAYVEDTDLSYQAWKMGWEVLFAPESVVYHRHRASSSRMFTRGQLECLILRNQLFFLWKNIRSWRYWLLHCFFLPWNCYRLARDRGIGVWRGVFDAIVALPSLEIGRLGSAFRASRSDGEIFELFEKPGLFFARNRRARSAWADSLKPRILWVTAYLPHLGRHAGAGRMFQLLKRMADNYRITLLSYLEHDEEREFLPDLEAVCDKVVAMRRSPPPRWQFFAYEPFDEFNTPGMHDALSEVFEETDFDLIQLEYSQMGCYADSAYGIPTIVTKHEVDFAACVRRLRSESSPPRKVRWFYNYLQVLARETQLLEGVDRVICMTEPDAVELRKYFSRAPVHVVNTGVDLDYFVPPPLPASGPRLVFVGAFQHHPNVDAMIYFCRDILPLIRQQVPDTSLTIVGSGPPPAVADLADQPGIEVTGFVPDIRPYMAKASVYIVPLRLGVGIRGKVLEAWAMRMPVVASPVACAGLRFEPDQNILVAESPRMFAEATISLLKDAGKRDRLGCEGRRTAEAYYSWEASADGLARLYSELIPRRVRR